jgi:hypothetical protein
MNKRADEILLSFISAKCISSGHDFLGQVLQLPGARLELYEQEALRSFSDRVLKGSSAVAQEVSFSTASSGQDCHSTSLGIITNNLPEKLRDALYRVLLVIQDFCNYRSIGRKGIGTKPEALVVGVTGLLNLGRAEHKLLEGHDAAPRKTVKTGRPPISRRSIGLETIRTSPW